MCVGSAGGCGNVYRRILGCVGGVTCISSEVILRFLQHELGRLRLKPSEVHQEWHTSSELTPPNLQPILGRCTPVDMHLGRFRLTSSELALHVLQDWLGRLRTFHRISGWPVGLGNCRISVAEIENVAIASIMCAWDKLRMCCWQALSMCMCP